MSIITFGTINKKYLIILALIIVRTTNLIAYYEAIGYYNGEISSLEEDVGCIIAGIIVMFFLSLKKRKEKKGRIVFYI